MNKICSIPENINANNGVINIIPSNVNKSQKFLNLDFLSTLLANNSTNTENIKFNNSGKYSLIPNILNNPAFNIVQNNDEDDDEKLFASIPKLLCKAMFFAKVK